MHQEFESVGGQFFNAMAATRENISVLGDVFTDHYFPA